MKPTSMIVYYMKVISWLWILYFSRKWRPIPQYNQNFSMIFFFFQFWFLRGKFQHDLIGKIRIGRQRRRAKHVVSINITYTRVLYSKLYCIYNPQISHVFDYLIHIEIISKSFQLFNLRAFQPKCALDYKIYLMYYVAILYNEIKNVIYSQ